MAAYLDLEMAGEIHRLLPGRVYTLHLPATATAREVRDVTDRLDDSLAYLPQAERPIVIVLRTGMTLDEVTPEQLAHLERLLARRP